MDMSIKVDTREFDKAMKEYMKYTKRTIVESINQHAYYIARNATLTTKAATKEEIRKDMEAASRKYPNISVAAILTNMERKRKGLKGLYGDRLTNAIEAFIKRRERARNFLRSGWIPAIKRLEKSVPKKGGTAIPPNTKRRRAMYGGATPAISTFSRKVIASIWNSSVGKKTTEKAIHYLETGMDKAIAMEIKSMMSYIQKKMDEAAARTM